MTSAEWPFAPVVADPSTTLAAQLIVLAKAPVPGRVKTRLTPPFTPQEAAMLAEAALVDTLEAGASASFARHMLCLDDQRAAPGTLRAELPARLRYRPSAARGWTSGSPPRSTTPTRSSPSLSCSSAWTPPR